MKIRNPFSVFICALSWALLLTASLMAESVIKLQLEQSTDLQNWQVVPVTPQMIDANGKIVLDNGFGQLFFRMGVQVLRLPTFVTPPATNTAIEEEESATLSVNVTGEGLSYQWYLGQAGDTTQPITGATSSSYITGALIEDAAYWVRVTNAAGIKDSDTLRVTINQPLTIGTQPVSGTINSGFTAALTVLASGTAPLTYQWYQGSLGTTTTPVGTNSATLTTPALTTTTSYWVRVSNAAGTVDSTLATVTVATPPLITSQPVSKTINSGGTATLTLMVSGTAPLTYQWYKGTTATLLVTYVDTVSGTVTATTPALTTTTSYWVRVSNAAGSVDSTLATVTVATPPLITSQPVSGTFNAGFTATLTVLASGTPPLTYQWYQGSLGTTTTPVGTNSATLTTSALTTTTSYWVRVSNAAGNVNSSLATVTVVSASAGLSQVPAGGFQMGDALDGDSNAPIRTVTLSAFYIGQMEVTKAEWDAVRNWGLANGYTDIAAGSGKGMGHPAQTITWWDVVKWCNARSQKDGLTPVYTVSSAVMKTGTTAPVVNWSANGYRLPTEAEWEKAARGGLSGERFPWGDRISQSQANYYGNAGSNNGFIDFGPSGYNSIGSVGGTSPATSFGGSFAANGYGLYDMSGNVGEWCWDWHEPYASGAQTDPRGASSGTDRVVRGGSWDLTAGYCRVAYRYGTRPTDRYSNIGFRIARSSVP